MDKPADTEATLNEIIAKRWSPRAFDPDGKVTDEQLHALLEAARWAPSFGNTQPARFLVGRAGSEVFDKIFATLTEGNQRWTRRVGVLLIGVAVEQNEKGDVPYAEYGVGLAVENLVLQAVAEGLAAHQMAGFDADAVRSAFELPAEARPVVAVAVGVQADAEILGDERSVSRERAPRKRLPLSEFAFGEWERPAF